MKVFARAGAVKASLCLCGGHPVFARAAAGEKHHSVRCAQCLQGLLL